VFTGPPFDHPSIACEHYTTVLLRWSRGALVLCDRWTVGSGGVGRYAPGEGGSVLLSVYYAAYLLAFAVVFAMLTRWRREGWLKVRATAVYDGMVVAILGALLGAKAAYVLVYNPRYYLVEPRTLLEALGRIFSNWSGMSSHGAVAGIVLGCLIWWRVSGAPVVHLGDAGCMGGAFGAICLRAANFLNGELVGRAAPSWLPWAMRFEVRTEQGNALLWSHGRIVEQVRDAATGATALREVPAPIAGGYELVHRGASGALEHVQAGQVPDALRDELLRVVTTPRHPSQLYQLVLEGLLLLGVLLWLRRRVQRVGVLSGVFLSGYALARIAGEAFRQPDVQFASPGNPAGTVWLGLSMGQVLSLGMLAFGVALLVRSVRRGPRVAELALWPRT
jgi:phosphatidylglycerol:prolipoprotein diacylglycerol transferase